MCQAQGRSHVKRQAVVRAGWLWDVLDVVVLIVGALKPLSMVPPGGAPSGPKDFLAICIYKDGICFLRGMHFTSKSIGFRVRICEHSLSIFCLYQGK